MSAMTADALCMQYGQSYWGWLGFGKPTGSEVIRQTTEHSGFDVVQTFPTAVVEPPIGSRR